VSEHKARIEWHRTSEHFDYPDYNREHQWLFPSGITVEASAAPRYLGSPDCVDPEEALVAAIASCHMLTFLAICARKHIVVDQYRDSAVGYLEKNKAGRLAVTHVELSPEIVFRDGALNADELAGLHRMAHEQCFIANSVRTEISVLGAAEP
jgi:organic hydroperoxide reductase OsmC/OhrA